MSEIDAVAQAASDAVQSMQNKQKEPMLAFSPEVSKPTLPPLYQPPEQKFAQAGNEFSTVSGRKRADRQAAISNITGAVKSGIDHINEKKQRALSMDIERLLEAQAGLAEAQQMGDKAAIEKNTQIINMLTTDPKKAKQLEKAFNISLMGGGKNQKENQAFYTAWQDFQKKQAAGDKTALNPNAQKLMQQQPQRLQLSPEMQAQAQAIKAGIMPTANMQVQAQARIYDALTKAKSAADRDKILATAAQQRADAIKYGADRGIDKANLMVGGRNYAQMIRAQSLLIHDQMTQATWDKRLKVLESIAGGNQFTKKINTEAKTYLDDNKRLSTDMQKAQAELDKQAKLLGFIPWRMPDNADTKRLKDQIEQDTFKLDLNNQRLKELEKSWGMVTQLGMSYGQGGSTEDDPTNDVPDDEVPE